MIIINFITIFNQTIILFLLLVVGFIVKKMEIIGSDSTQGLTNLVIYVTLPAMIISSMNYRFSRERFTDLLYVFLLAMVVYAAMIFISRYAIKFLSGEQAEKDVYQFLLIFANVGFMGYPVINVIFGSEGVFLAAIYNLVFHIYIWTVGVLIITRSHKKETKFKWEQLINPGTISVLIGFSIFLFSLDLPAPILDTINILGEATTPLSMIVVGSLLTKVNPSSLLNNFNLWIITGIRLLVFPLLSLLVFKPLGVSDLVLGVIVVLTGMPAAANAAIFAQEFDGDASMASRGVFLTTLLALITIPLIASLL